MKIAIRLVVMIFIVSCWNANVFAQQKSSAKKYHDWWNDPYPRRPENPHAKKLPLIQVKGNVFVDSNGDTVLFRGLSISDPDKIENQGH